MAIEYFVTIAFVAEAALKCFVMRAFGGGDDTATSVASASVTAKTSSSTGHAAHTDQMRDILRDQFVRLYERPVLEDLRASTAARFPGTPLPPLPARGGLDLNLVRDSQYFFS